MDTYYFARMGDRLVQLQDKHVVQAREAGFDVLELVPKSEVRPRPSRRSTDNSKDKSALHSG